MFNWLKRLLLAIEKLAENSQAESEYVRKLYEKQTQMEFEAIVFRRDIADLIVETKQLSGRLTILNTELEAHKALKRHSHGKKENITPPTNGRELIADPKLYQTAKAAIEDKTGASRYQVEGKDAGPETPMQAMDMVPKYAITVTHPETKWQPGDVPPGTVTAGRITLDDQADGCK